MPGTQAFLGYLFVLIKFQKVKKSTWEKRLAAVKKYLSIEKNINFEIDSDYKEKIAGLRKLYQDVKYKELTRTDGKMAVDKEELLEQIRLLDTREKAICLVNLVTANRPSEMVTLKIQDFKLEQNYVSVYLQKQIKWVNKRLTHEAVAAVRSYVRTYQLKPDDFFVGRVLKNKRYVSAQVSTEGYRKMLRKWTELTSYNFRKTQVSAMHIKGADLPTIAKQTGHKSLEVLTNNYLSVSDSTID